MPDYRETIRAIEDAMHEAQVQERFDDWRRLERARHKAILLRAGTWREPPEEYTQGRFANEFITAEPITPPTTRYCGRCHQSKPLDQFYPKNGRVSRCKECMAAAKRERLQAKRKCALQGAWTLRG